MKLTKLGIEWGPAFTEAQPVRITSRSGAVVAVIYEREDGNIAIETFDSIKLERLAAGTSSGDLRITIGDP